MGTFSWSPEVDALVDFVEDHGGSMGQETRVAMLALVGAVVSANSGRLSAERDAALAEKDALRDAILDINSHATAINHAHPYDEWRDGFYIVTIGSLHRALGVVGHSSAPAAAEREAMARYSNWLVVRIESGY